MTRNGDIERQGERAPMADKGASALDDAKKSALKEARDSARKAARRPHAPSPTTVVAVVMLAVGVGVIAYPTVSDWWNSYHQTRTISQYIEYVQNTDPATLKAMIDDARDYNKRLRTKTNRYNMTPEEKAEYDSLLNLMGDGVIGYVVQLFDHAALDAVFGADVVNVVARFQQVRQQRQVRSHVSGGAAAGQNDAFHCVLSFFGIGERCIIFAFSCKKPCPIQRRGKA